MPTIRDVRNALAAGAVVDNILAGSKFEFPRVHTSVTVYAVEDGAAVNGAVHMTMTFGNAIDIDDASIPTEAAGLGPNTNQHKMGAGLADPGDRIQIRLQNTGAGAVNVRTLIELRT